ncbi:site-specific DNA-methyltransferase [Lysinibacillus capsici]|uniref:site-specific DNA-methyltransferase n=1 Tax=Lysinibacillus capsici TaxID=2115968 RepID=UPI0032E3CFE3
MGTNLSKLKRDELTKKINHIRSFIEHHEQDGNSNELLRYINEIEKDIKGKKYGLVFEEHIEKIDSILEEHTPVLIEEKELFLDNGGQMNFLIEGDNLAALNLLNKTLKEEIDFIYIDPPYNTGNKDFIYDDIFVSKEDAFKHSKWLSFMEKRLSMAKKLLSKDGFIAISIDELEFHGLKLLCDDVFGDKNFIGEFVWKARSGKGGTDTFISMQHEYILCYAKDKNQVNFRPDISITTKEQKEGLRQWGQGVYREDRKTMFFPIFYKEGEFKLPTVEEVGQLLKNDEFDDVYLNELNNKYENEGYEAILPYIENEYGRWRKGYTGIQELIDDKLLSVEGSVGNRIIKKIIPPGRETEMAVDSLLLKVGSASTGTAEIKELFNKKVFDTTKPLDLVKYLIDLATYNKDEAIILDFFAGSGTTGDAVLQINKALNKNLRFVLCTNNQGNICRDITYPRIVKRSKGYSFKGKKKEVLYEKKLNVTLLKRADKVLKEIDKIKEEQNGNYDKFETKVDDNTLRLIGNKTIDGSIDGIGGSLKYFKINYVPVIDRLYYEYADKLLQHVQELVELENGINLTNKREFAIILDDDDLEIFIKHYDKDNEFNTIYIGHDVLPSSEQEAFFREHNLKVNIIPDYYYKELRG